MITRGKSRRKVCCADGEEDRLSKLPDDVLSHILSFLDTKYAVQTSVLSKRFKMLSSTLPVLNFDSKAFRKRLDFENFINHVLAVRDPKMIRSLSFSVRRTRVVDIFCEVVERLVNKVAEYVVLHNIKNLTINVELGSFAFPTCLYSSDSLRRLHLRRTLLSIRQLEKPFNFPQMTMLHLEGVEIIQPNLFSSCPNLIKLCLIKCFLQKSVDAFTIIAPKLASLVISFTKFVEHSVKLVLSASMLSSLYYKGRYPLMVSASEFTNLQTMGIDIDQQHVGNMTDQEESKVTLDLIDMLHGLCKAKKVTLSLGTIKVLSKFPALLGLESSPFKDLEHLRLMAAKGNNFLTIPLHLLAYFHNGSPRAELVMKLHRCKQCSRDGCRDFMHYID